MKPAIIATALASALLTAGASAADYDVAEDFDYVALDTASATQFLQACVPSQATADPNLIPDAQKDKNALVTIKNDKISNYLILYHGRGYCIKKSPQKYPELPLAAFNETLNFKGMSDSTERHLRSDLSRQLARSGAATALVVFESNGNAIQLSYMFVADAPTKLYYHSHFFKKGEYTEQSYSSVHRVADGGYSTVSRNGETQKFLFNAEPSAKPEAQIAVIRNPAECQPQYPAESRERQETGSVQMAFNVDANGIATSAKINKSSGYRSLDQAALRALQACHFEPAVKGGKAVESIQLYQYNWTL